MSRTAARAPQPQIDAFERWMVRELEADVVALETSFRQLIAGPLTREQARGAYEIAARLDVMRQRLEASAVSR